MSNKMEGFDLIKDSEDSKIFFINFEKALDMSPIVIFNETTIEFPGMLIFSTEESGLLTRILNPGLEQFKVSDLDFANMQNALKEKKEQVYFVDKHISPKATVRLNMNIVKANMIFMKKFEQSILVNDILFTTSGSEFHGSGMFTGRDNVFLLDKLIFDEIEALLEA